MLFQYKSSYNLVGLSNPKVRENYNSYTRPHKKNDASPKENKRERERDKSTDIVQI